MRQLRIRQRDPNTALYRFLDWLILLVIGTLVVVFVAFVAMMPCIVPDNAVGEVRAGNLVFVDKIGLYFLNYGRGDILAYRDEVIDPRKEDLQTAEKTLIGRAIAFGGEDVLITGGSVYINGCLLDETDYATEFPGEAYASFTVLENEVFILPDDRAEIIAVIPDEFTFGYDEIVGEVRFRIYPLGEMELFV